MSQQDDTRIDSALGDEAVSAEQLQGVRTARVIGFFIDYAIVFLLSVPVALLIGVLGIVTLGLAWGLYAVLIPAVALVYLALTMGGPKQSTIGMRFMGVRIAKIDGGRVDPLLAVLHGLLFWFIHSVAVIIPLLVTFFSSRKRLLHDILLGTYVRRD